MDIYALTMGLILLKITLVDIRGLMSQSALAIRFVVEPVALVDRAVRISPNTPALTNIHTLEPESCIAGACVILD